MKTFKNSLTNKIISERWCGGKDMEQYFVDRGKEFIDKIKTTKKCCLKGFYCDACRTVDTF